jgi:hypothetical protein
MSLISKGITAHSSGWYLWASALPLGTIDKSENRIYDLLVCRRGSILPLGGLVRMSRVAILVVFAALATGRAYSQNWAVIGITASSWGSSLQSPNFSLSTNGWSTYDFTNKTGNTMTSLVFTATFGNGGSMKLACGSLVLFNNCTASGATITFSGGTGIGNGADFAVVLAASGPASFRVADAVPESSAMVDLLVGLVVLAILSWRNILVRAPYS